MSTDVFNRIRKYGIVNLEGKELIPPKYHKIDLFQNDIAAFSVSERGIQYGLIHISGKIILEPSYRNIESLIPFGETEEVIWSASYFDKDEKRVLHKLLSKDGKEISVLRFHQKNNKEQTRQSHYPLFANRGSKLFRPFHKQYS